MSVVDWVCKKISFESASERLSDITISRQQVLPSKLDACANVTTCCSVRQVGENPGNEVDCTHLQHQKNFPLIFACPVEQSHASLVCFLVTTDLREPSPKRRVREVSWCCRIKGCLSKGQVKIRAFFKALQYESSC